MKTIRKGRKLSSNILYKKTRFYCLLNSIYLLVVSAKSRQPPFFSCVLIKEFVPHVVTGEVVCKLPPNLWDEITNKKFIVYC